MTTENISTQLDRLADEIVAAGARRLSPEERVYLTECKSALHEAGHLAAAILLGIEASAEIGWDAESSARTFVNGTVDEHLFTTFAGVVVSHRYYLPNSGVEHDLRDIQQLLERLEKPQEAEDMARTLAEKFVTERETEIFRLANQLQKRKSLDGCSAKAIFEDTETTIPMEFLRAVAAFRFARWEYPEEGAGSFRCRSRCGQSYECTAGGGAGGGGIFLAFSVARWPWPIKNPVLHP